MNMKEVLVSILNVLTQIETKGQGTLMMADCIQALDQLISKIHSEVHEPEPEPKPEVEVEAENE